MCALTLKSETTEEFSKSLSSPTENHLRVCINLLKKYKAGYLIKMKIKDRAFGRAKEWIMEQGKNIQPVLIAIRGMKNIDGHCICAMNGQIVDGIFKTSLQLNSENFDFVLGETITEIAFCYIFYQNRNFLLDGIEIKNYQQMQLRKRKEKEESV